MPHFNARMNPAPQMNNSGFVNNPMFFQNTNFPGALPISNRSFPPQGLPYYHKSMHYPMTSSSHLSGVVADNEAYLLRNAKRKRHRAHSDDCGTGRWTNEEHKRFLVALKMYAQGDWAKIAEYVETRTVVQVRSHAQKYFLALKRKQVGVEEEESDNNSNSGGEGSKKLKNNTQINE